MMDSKYFVKNTGGVRKCNLPFLISAIQRSVFLFFFFFFLKKPMHLVSYKAIMTECPWEEYESRLCLQFKA